MLYKDEADAGIRTFEFVVAFVGPNTHILLIFIDALFYFEKLTTIINMIRESNVNKLEKSM